MSSRRYGLLAPILLLPLLFFSCSGKGDRGAREPLRRVILLGIDGADWTIIHPLVHEGKLPHFARLIEAGATGDLESLEPMLSPLLWTTIATGKPPEEHGILSFTIPDEESGKKKPVTSLHRRVDAFWNILSDHHRTVDLVGWLATHPPEAVNGVMVSDRIGFLAFAAPEVSANTGRVYPPEREEEIDKLVVGAQSVRYEEFRKILDIEREEFEENRSLAFDPKNPVNNMILLYASAKTIYSIATHLLDTDRPDLLAAYFELVDATGHLFMPYAPPRTEWVDDKDYERFRGAVEEAYVFQDELLGGFMKRCGQRDVLMVVSDHGFKSGEARLKGSAEIWAGKAAKWHRLHGIVAIYGSGVKQGAKISRATLFDITPTLLALQGLPRASDMRGRVLEEAFTEELLDEFNPSIVESFEEGGRQFVSGAEGDEETSEQALKKLEALGYISTESPDVHTNLGQRYQNNGEYEKAIEEYKKALDMNPYLVGALNNLGICYSRLKRFEEAEKAFMKALSIDAHDAYAMSNLALMYMESGKLASARKYGEMAVKEEPGYANAHLTLGAIYANMGEYELAERSFKKVLKLDPTNQSALDNLDKLKLISSKK